MSQRFQNSIPKRAWFTTPKGHIDGLVLSQDADTAHDVIIGAGEASLTDAADATRPYMLGSQTSVITKQTDADWAEGDDAGGFPSGLTLSASTRYEVFVIGKQDGKLDGGFDTSTTAANLLADATGYGYYRNVGCIYTDGSSNIIDFVQKDDGRFTWSYSLTSGTSVSMGSIPASVDEVVFTLDELLLSGTDYMWVRIGDSGGIETTNYTSVTQSSSAANHGITTAFESIQSNAMSGQWTIRALDNDHWISASVLVSYTDTVRVTSAGSGLLSAGPLTQVQFRSSGTDTFTSGLLSISWREPRGRTLT